MKRFAEAKNEAIVFVPVIVKPAIVVIEPRLGVVAVHIEQVRVAITVAFVYNAIYATTQRED